MTTERYLSPIIKKNGLFCLHNFLSLGMMIMSVAKYLMPLHLAYTKLITKFVAAFICAHPSLPNKS